MVGILSKDRTSAVVVLTRMAALAAMLVAIALPLGFFFAEYNYLAGVLEAEAEVDSFYVSRLASSNPALWRYEEHRLEDLLDRKTTPRVSGQRRVLDLEGRLIADSPGKPPSPVITRKHNVLDAGTPVGMVEASASLRFVLLRTALVALASAGLGYFLFYLLHHAPIRAVREAESRLQKKNEELRAINEELKAFMYSAAHDLRQPLVNIRGFTTELARSVREMLAILAAHADRCSPEEREQLNRVLAEDVLEAEGFIGASVDRMSGLINALLKLSQAGYRKLKPELISMNALAQSLLAGMAQQIREKDATVIVGDLPDMVADRTAMEQILGNLLDNAVKYLVPGRPGKVELSGQRIAGSLLYQVRDNGRGISADDMPRLFHLFRRVGKQDVAGDGVGLAYAKALIKRHGGRIWCESEAGAGTTFSFAIPTGASTAE